MAATTTRAYVIRRKDGTGSPRMVEAYSQAAALRHVATDVFSIETPTAIEAVRLLQTGVAPERVKAEQAELSTD